MTTTIVRLACSIPLLGLIACASVPAATETSAESEIRAGVTLQPVALGADVESATRELAALCDCTGLCTFREFKVTAAASLKAEDRIEGALGEILRGRTEEDQQLAAFCTQPSAPLSAPACVERIVSSHASSGELGRRLHFWDGDIDDPSWTAAVSKVEAHVRGLGPGAREFLATAVHSHEEDGEVWVDSRTHGIFVVDAAVGRLFVFRFRSSNSC
jgi:hypothetical protein